MLNLRLSSLFSFSMKIMICSVLVSSFVTPVFSAEVVLIPEESLYRYRLGNEEASSPDPTSWREREFDDASWAESRAPFGYGDPPFFTDLSAVEPPMRGNYTSIFLRNTFDVNPDFDNTLLLVEANYDDGFIVWINGQEVIRENMRSEFGDPVLLTDRAARGKESGEYLPFEIPDADSFLVPGINSIAIQAFNTARSSNDFKFDMRLINPNGPDIAAPMAKVLPQPGTELAQFSQVKIIFDEPVQGLEASDLTLNGTPALSYEELSEAVFIFHFPPADPGEIELKWIEDHGIIDLAPAENAFEGGEWSYTVNPNAPVPKVRISEFVAINNGGLLDDDRESSDWLEIENLEDREIDLTGWYLTDDSAQPDLWAFPQVSLQAGQRIVVFCSGKDRVGDDGELHTNFQLSGDGEYLGLFNAELPARLVSAFEGYPRQVQDVSYGRGLGDRVGYFENPTPEEPNDPEHLLTGLLQAPQLSHEAGIFETEFELSIYSSNPQDQIIFRLDGRDPTEQNGTLYEGPITIQGTPDRPTFILKARAIREGYLPSEIVTRSFVFPETVIQQKLRPQGFPVRWGAAPGVDYETDKDLLSNPQTQDRVVEGLKDLPTVSIVMNVDDMFGTRGIYSNSTGEGFLWERACSAELIFPDGKEGFQVGCGIRILGGASRNPTRSPKHSFRLLFKGLYGPNRLRYRLYDDSKVESFDNLVLRANYNNSWIHWDSGQRRRGMLIRDQWAKDTQNDMGHPSGHARYTNLYINGLYWGVYILVERPNAAFAASYHGGDKEDYDALNSAQPVDGNTVKWTQLLNVVRGGIPNLQAYENLKKHLDIENFIDYMLVNFYGANADWPHHNWYGAVNRNKEEGYRFYCWDTERILESLGASRIGANDSNSPGEIHARLRGVAEYQIAFGDRVQKHFFDGGALTPQAASDRYQKRVTELEKGIWAESVRWGDYRRDVHPSSNGPYELYQVNVHWMPQWNFLRSSIFPGRSGVVLNQLRNNRLFPRIEAPIILPLASEVEVGTQAQITKPEGQEGEIYITFDGSDPRAAWTGEVAPGATLHAGLPISIPSRTQIKARLLVDGQWSALVDVTYTVAQDFSKLHISELMFNPEDGGEFEYLELHNSGDVPIDLSGVYFSNGIELTFEDGTHLPPNSHRVIVSNITAFRTLYPDAEIIGIYEGQLANEGEKVTLKDSKENSILSIEYDDEGFWPVSADGLGYSLVLADPAMRLDSPHAWRPSSLWGGSPGAVDPVDERPQVLVQRVSPHPSEGEEAWIELANLMDRSVDLSGWFLGSSSASLDTLRQLQFPDGFELNSQEVKRISQSEWNAWAGDLQLSNGPGEVYLSEAHSDGSLTGNISGLEYQWVPSESLVGVVETSLDLNMWRVLNDGAPWVSDVVINEIHYNPGERDGVEFLELFNRGQKAVSLFDSDLNQGWKLRGLSQAIEKGTFQFPRGTTLSAQSFLLLVKGNEQRFRELMDVPDGIRVISVGSSSLDDGGEELRLERPIATGEGQVTYEVLDQVVFNDKDPWPTEADGFGPSLERRDASKYGNEALNWGASETDGGTPGAFNSISSDAPQGGNRVPGDINADGRSNISDSIVLLRHLYLGQAIILPCTGESIAQGGNLPLLDGNGDGVVDQSDAIHQLLYLFGGGQTHVLGTGCTPIVDCSEACTKT